MPGYPDLAGRVEVWRTLRGLRSNPPGAAAASRDRARTFQTALEQAQQLMEAAEGAGYATRPIQLFYALSQAGRAIAAVATQLPATTKVPDRANPGTMITTTVDWKLNGHGITAPGTNVKRVGQIVVRADWTGLLPGVAMALGLPCLVPDEKIKISELWPLIWDTRGFGEIVDESGFPALCLTDVSELITQRGRGRLFVAKVGGIPRSVRTQIGVDQAALGAFLDHYPSLAGWAHRPLQGPAAPLDWEIGGSLQLSWSHPHTLQNQATRYLGRELLATPSVGSMNAPLDPFIAWWAVLFSLSMMARYEPSYWAGMISIDSSRDANSIEHLLDHALDAIPYLVLLGIAIAAP